MELIYNKKRDTNIELLRIVAMILVVSIHCISNGLVLYTQSINIYNGLIVKFMYGCSCVANGVFLLLTGYYLADKKINIKKIFNLWGKTLLYSVLIYIILSIFGKEVQTFKSFMPILSCAYWFISAYIVLYLLAPILNIAINKMTKNQFKYILIIFYIFYGIIRNLFNDQSIFQGDIPCVIMLYLTGAYVKKYVEIKQNQHYFIKYILLAVILSLMNFILNVLIKLDINETLKNILTTFAGKMWDYNNILLIIMAVLLFMKFKTINITSKKLSNVITFISPSVFSIYIIHNNIHFHTLWRQDGSLYMIHSPWLIPYLIFLIISVFVVCLLIDLLRRGIYHLLKKIPIIHKSVNKLNEKFEEVNLKLNSYIS